MFCLHKPALRTLYFSLVHPYLHYCISVWATTYPTNFKKRLILLKKRAMGIISKSCFEDAHTDTILEDLYVLPLHNIGKIMYQYKAGVLPNIFNNTLLLRCQVYDHNTRNTRSFHDPQCRTNIRLFTFQYQGPLFFNDTLSPDIQNSISVATFNTKSKKYLLTKFLPSPAPNSPSYFFFSIN